MCRILKISRSTYYYKRVEKQKETILDNAIILAFKQSRNNYGTRKLKIVLEHQGMTISRRRLARIMKTYQLVSNYTKQSYKHHSKGTNHSPIKNELNRQFTQEVSLNVIVTDLTYVRVGTSWCYVCFIIDLYNREIIGYSVGRNKDINIVKEALASINRPLSRVTLFHTDRGKEFDNRKIDEWLIEHDIQRSLSKKGCPYDNAVAESTYKSFKKECINLQIFSTFEQLKLELFDYVNWWNHIRIHGTLNYETPSSYRLNKELIDSL